MASNQTKNYGLSQWELTDDVRMEDFNADNAKIDAALAGKFGPGNPGWIMGSYVGNGSTTAHEIQLGFAPSALIIAGIGAGCGFMVSADGQSGAISSHINSGSLSWGTGYIKVTENGFSVRKVGTSYSSSINEADKTYLYIAFP